MSTDMEALTTRIAMLERRLRYRQWGLAILTVSLIGVAAAGAAMPVVDQLDVRELRIVDRDGKPRMLLMTSHLGHAKLMIVDPDGLPRMQLSSESLLFEERGRWKGMLSADAGFDLFDDAGKRKKK